MINWYLRRKALKDIRQFENDIDDFYMKIEKRKESKSVDVYRPLYDFLTDDELRVYDAIVIALHELSLYWLKSPSKFFDPKHHGGQYAGYNSPPAMLSRTVDHSVKVNPFDFDGLQEKYGWADEEFEKTKQGHYDGWRLDPDLHAQLREFKKRFPNPWWQMPAGEEQDDMRAQMEQYVRDHHTS